ncbi:MAG: hypothetical protein ACPGYT_08225 [Nitrospirales bacterium]
MRNLLVQKEVQTPVAHQLGIESGVKSCRYLGMALGLDRRHRYEKMVESVYGEPDAANRLLLKTLYLSVLDEPTESLVTNSHSEG